MLPKKARISTSDVPAWQRSIAGFQMVCTVASTSTSTVDSTSTSTCSSSHAEVANEENHDFPSAKNVRVCNFCDKWAKDRPWFEFLVTEDAMYCTFCEKYAA